MLADCNGDNNVSLIVPSKTRDCAVAAIVANNVVSIRKKLKYRGKNNNRINLDYYIK